MQAQILNRKILKNIPSASGIERVADKFYIISDNSPWLYVVNEDFELIAERQIFPSSELKQGVIPKKKKPDFEAFTSIKVGNEARLLVLGSGSKSPERDRAFLLNPENLLEEPEEVSLTEIYDFLRSLPEVAEGFNLNIEAVACTDDKILLFQRGNISGNNVMLSYKMPDFLDFLQKKKTRKPLPNIKKFNLPVLENLLSGFSGATFLPEKNLVLFTASVENTKNEIDDGRTLGSYVGIIDLKNLKPTLDCALLKENDKIFTGKVESITAFKVQENHLRVLVVTDSDGGDSEILEIEISDYFLPA